MAREIVDQVAKSNLGEPEGAPRGPDVGHGAQTSFAPPPDISTIRVSGTALNLECLERYDPGGSAMPP